MSLQLLQVRDDLAEEKLARIMRASEALEAIEVDVRRSVSTDARSRARLAADVDLAMCSDLQPRPTTDLPGVELLARRECRPTEVRRRRADLRLSRQSTTHTSIPLRQAGMRSERSLASA